LVPAGAVSNRITGVGLIVDCATAHRRPTGREGLADDSNCGRCHCRDLGSRGDWHCVLILIWSNTSCLTASSGQCAVQRLALEVCSVSYDRPTSSDGATRETRTSSSRALTPLLSTQMTDSPNLLAQGQSVVGAPEAPPQPQNAGFGRDQSASARPMDRIRRRQCGTLRGC
jgi:hypothetical protein